MNPDPRFVPFPRYEFLSSQEVADIVGAALDNNSSAEAACETLIEQAALLWRLEEVDYRDDITAIVVRLNPFDLMRKEVEEAPRGDLLLFDACRSRQSFGSRRSLDERVESNGTMKAGVLDEEEEVSVVG